MTEKNADINGINVVNYDGQKIAAKCKSFHR